MSELITTSAHAGTRLYLLATVSVLALAANAASSGPAKAEDSDRPTVWIELGAQASHIDGTGDRLMPDFMRIAPAPSVFEPVSPIDAQKPARFGLGGEARISILPEGTNWVFSAGVVYGRSNGSKHVQKQDGPLNVHKSFQPPFVAPSSAYSSDYPAAFRNFAETRAQNRESHLIVDFAAGKDVGLGMFGRDSSSVVSAGVRFAQFTARSNLFARARPDLSFYNWLEVASPAYAAYAYLPQARFHAYTATGSAWRNFHGIGPSISWEVSAPLMGDTDSAELSLDWGLSASLLFGRQKASVAHQTTTHIYQAGGYGAAAPQIAHGGHATNRSVTVPNAGGFAGLSVKFPNSKISFGYRGDIFFGAMDTGIDARHTQNISFHGPFAKLSVGLGG